MSLVRLGVARRIIASAKTMTYMVSTGLFFLINAHIIRVDSEKNESFKLALHTL